MRLLIACIAGALSFSAFAMTDKDLCEAYGVDLASNNSKGRIEFMSEMTSRIENKTWTLSANQCNEIAMDSKAEYDLELALDMWSD